MTGSLGGFLRSKREERGIPLEEMAERTRIPLRYLTALEEDRLDALPGKVYERLFIRTYAEMVGINVEELGRQFKEIQNTLELKVRPEDERRSPMLKRAIWSLGILTVILVAVLLGTRRERGPSERPAEPAPIPNLIPARPPDTLRQASPASPSEPESLKLELEATEDNWVRLSADHKTSFEAELKPGERRTFRAEQQLNLSLGRAWAVNAWVNGRRLKKLGKEGSTLINFELTRENFPAMIDSAAKP